MRYNYNNNTDSIVPIHIFIELVISYGIIGGDLSNLNRH